MVFLKQKSCLSNLVEAVDSMLDVLAEGDPVIPLMYCTLILAKPLIQSLIIDYPDYRVTQITELQVTYFRYYKGLFEQ